MKISSTDFSFDKHRYTFGFTFYKIYGMKGSRLIYFILSLKIPIISYTITVEHEKERKR